jgi:hypothetical protein
MKDIGPKLRGYFKTKGYTNLSFPKWDTIEKLFNLLWENSTYSITIDYSYLERSLTILDVKGYRGKDGLSLETFFLANNDWNRIITIWSFVCGFVRDNPALEEKGSGRILVKLSKTHSIDCTLIA